MEEQDKKKRIGKVPYMAFFVGLLLMLVLLIYL